MHGEASSTEIRAGSNHLLLVRRGGIVQVFYAGLKNSQELSFTVHAVDFQGGCKLFATLVFLRTDQGCNCVPFYDANSKLLYCKVGPREIAASDKNVFLGAILPWRWERSHGR